ncbi:MAG: ABC transporter substrate-binding protein [Rhodospirillales bacterium]|nr:ABC transporter substrate-binding protein [Rhodospirillales bacterium]
MSDLQSIPPATTTPSSLSPEPLLIDAAGVLHRPVGAGARIVSLVPSLTELLFDLGLGARLVGRTAFCVHPKDRVKTVSSVGGTKTINMRKLRRLAPTHAIVNIDETPRLLAEQLTAEGIEVVVTHPVEVADNLTLYRLIGSVFGAEAAAEALSERFRQAYSTTIDAARGRPSRRVLYLIWKDPWMTVTRETYVSRMLALAGWHTVPATADRRYPAITLDEPLLTDVDLVLFASEPFPFQPRHIKAFRATHPGHAAKALAIDGEMVSWYGSRAVAGLAYLAALVREHDVQRP